MRKILWMTLWIAVWVLPSHAATLGMHWLDYQTNTITLSEGDTALINIYVDMLPGETLDGFGLGHSPLDGDPVTQVNFQVSQFGWGAVDDIDGPLGRPWQGIAGFASNSTMNLVGPGRFSLAIQTIQLTDAGDLSDLEISFNHSGPPDGSWHKHPLLLSPWADYVWNANYHTTYAGYAAYGDWGNPGWSAIAKNGQERGQPTPNPLIIQRIPEPAGLALLAFGCLAVMRRRMN